jgi:hypothetical protein
VQGSDQADALSWHELKLAAEAGFEELLRHQEAAAAAGTSSMRCPGMLRAKGGGAVPAAAAGASAGAAANAADTGGHGDASCAGLCKLCKLCKALC